MWMKNGLGISLFKLVIYTGNNYIYEAFQRLKQNFNEGELDFYNYCLCILLNRYVEIIKGYCVIKVIKLYIEYKFFPVSLFLHLSFFFEVLHLLGYGGDNLYKANINNASKIQTIK